MLSEEGDYYVMNGGITPSGYYSEYNVPAGAISISEGGNSCGYVQFNKEPFWSGGHCYSLRPGTGSLRHIIVATPDGEAFRYAHVPALGAKGMDRVASNALHGTYDSGKGLNVHIRNVARIARILYPDNDRVRGNSWSGKSALSEEQRRQLRELERSGAANASFEDTTYVEFLG